MTREEAQQAWEKIVDKGFADYEMLTFDQRVWFNLEPLTTEGIIDHYVNHGAEHNGDTIVGLEFLGHHDIANLLRGINKLFKGGTPPENIDERNDQIVNWNGTYDELLDKVNDQFWKLSDSLEKSLLDHLNKTGIGTK